MKSKCERADGVPVTMVPLKAIKKTKKVMEGASHHHHVGKPGTKSFCFRLSFILIASSSLGPILKHTG